MMRPTPRFFTAAMARLYAEQGYLRKAAQIYRDLLNQEPDRDDLRRCLLEVEEKISRQTHPARKELGLLLREWVDLAQKHQALKRKG
jgi:hypothetical protein